MGKTPNRTRLFIENFFSYGLIGVLQKAVPIIMLPIMTRLIVDTADYGTADMFSTLVEFGGNIAAVGLYDATFREYFEKEDEVYRHQVLSTALRLEISFAFAVAVVLIIFSRAFSKMFLGSERLSYIVCMAGIAILFGGARTILIAPIRIRNRRSLYVGSNLFASAVSYLCAVLLIMRGHGYMGLIWGTLISTVTITLFYAAVNGRDFDIRCYDKKAARELLRIGLPIAPVFLIYWVFHSMDKIMITNMLGLADVGIYSIGAKVASVSQLIYTAFAGGWQYFAFRTMRDEDQVAMTSIIMESLAAIAFFGMYMASLVDNYIFELVFTGDYVKGVLVFPYLFLSPLLLMLYQTAGNQFLVIKKSYLGLYSLSLGCIVNLVLNYVGIRCFGIKGAAMATLIGYAVSLGVGLYFTRRLRLINISKRFLLMCGVMAGFMAMQFYSGEGMLTICYALAGMVLCIGLYKNDVKRLVNGLKNKNKDDDKQGEAVK